MGADEQSVEIWETTAANLKSYSVSTKCGHLFPDGGSNKIQLYNNIIIL